MHQHNFIPSLNHKGYEHCIDCGTYHSIAPLPPKEIYEDKPYWGEDSGRSTLEQQVSNLTCTDDCGISKVDRVLQFIPKRGKNFLEIGCAPGELLRQMVDRNYEVFGIEPSIQYVDFICRHAPEAKVLQGYFPEATRDSNANIFDCIVAMDVFEHAPDYDAFIKEIHRLLIPNGTAILMSPIIYEDGFIREGEFRPDEHIWLFTKKFLEPYLSEIFSKVEFRRWLVSHEIVIVTK